MCSVGWRAIERMLFLWYVSVDMHFLWRRSHNFIVWSWEPEMTCRGPARSEVDSLVAARAELKREMQRQHQQQKHPASAAFGWSKAS